jgi:hypothetical protein
MSVNISCPHCTASLLPNAALRDGYVLACPKCGKSFLQPRGSAAPPAPAMPVAEPLPPSPLALPEAVPLVSPPPAAMPMAEAVTVSPPLARPAPWLATAQAYIDRGGHAAGLDAATFAILIAGLASSAFVLILTCFTWYSVATDVRMFGMPITDGFAFSGVSYLEGKLVFVGMLGTGVWLGLGIWRKHWLPGALLAAGSVQVFAMIILFGLRWRIAALYSGVLAEQAQLARFMTGNPLTKGLEQVSKETNSTFLPDISGGVGWALVFAIVLTLAATVAFAVGSVRRPLTFAFLNKPEIGPVVKRYGALAAGYGLAFLLGIVVVVCRQ